jgi:1,4-dihydroxy-6-naphthoate synthase
VDPEAVQRALRRSVAYALAHPEEPMETVRRHAQELEETVMREHIRLYVNGFSEDLGPRGERAVETLLAKAAELGEAQPVGEPLFPGGGGRREG